MSVVPMAPRVFFQLLSLHLASPGFSEQSGQCEQQDTWRQEQAETQDSWICILGHFGHFSSLTFVDICFMAQNVVHFSDCFLCS